MSAKLLAILQEGSAALYLGGAISMELLLRHAQRYLPGPQTAVTCQVSGKVWKRWGQGALLVWGASTLGLLAWVLPRALSRALGTAFFVVWIALAGVLATLSLVAHPALAQRIRPNASSEERLRAREELKRAIRRMDVLLRVELALASLLTLLTAVIAEEAISRG